MNTLPKISIIIPTHNRCALLQRSLIALEKQNFPPVEIEVIIVADSCEDNTEQMVIAFAKKSAYHLELLSHSAKSASATRNLGAKHARANILLFLDDDVVADPNWVQAHWCAQQDQTIVLGYSKPVLPNNPNNPSWWQYNARIWWEDSFRAMLEPDHRFTYRDFFSGNVSMATSLFHKVGGFDLSMKGRLEDYELGMRLLKSGVKFHFEPEALGYHHDFTDLALWLHRIYQEGVADVQIADRHPELRNVLFGNYEDQRQGWTRTKRLVYYLAFAEFKYINLIEKFLIKLAHLAEYWFRSRWAWWHISGLARELNYWRGVADTIRSRQQMATWLQEAPLPPTTAIDAPTVDLTALPDDTVLEHLLDRAAHMGLRIAVEGTERFAIPPQPGAEPLNKQHLQYTFRDFKKRNFVPSLALKLIESTGDLLK